MREIGGYIELETFQMPMLHEEAIKLNCARNCLAYLIETKSIKKIAIPKFLCMSISDICKKYDVIIRYYSVDVSFKPIDIKCMDDEWLYLVNYYGQLTNKYVMELYKKCDRLIVDNVQAYYQEPVEGVDTIYTCRKFFGVSDGALLYSNVTLERNLQSDFSYERIHHILGRYEKTASEFYKDYVTKEESFDGIPIMKMSKLTFNMLHGIDYERIQKIRYDNFSYLHKELSNINELHLSIFPKGPFMYPLYIKNGDLIRKKLQKEQIYIPTLWPDVFTICHEDELEYDMAKNILPLPIDQRYTLNDMEFIANRIKDTIIM